MGRLSVLMLLGVALLAGGCATKPIDYSKVDADKPGTTFLFLGLWNVFSKGLDDVRDNLNEAGYHASSLPGPEWRSVGDQIIAMERRGELRRPLILGGHSLGADKALYLSEKLKRAGVTVDYVLLLDPTNPPTVTSNVQRCHNIYLSHRLTDWFPAFRGIAVETASRETELINFDVRSAKSGALSEIDFNHFDIETDPDIQALMTELILAQLRGDPDFAALFPVKVNGQTN
jgi:hypothetical protein